MSILQKIPHKSLPIETVNVFSSTYNTGGAGQYNFSLIAGNINQVVIPVNNRFYYFIDKISFSATLDQGVYLKSIDEIIKFRLKLKNTSQNLYPRAIPGVIYHDGMDFNYFFNSPKSNDELLITCTGILNQVPETVGIPNIKISLSFIIYEISDGENVRAMLDRLSTKTGNFFRGE